MKFTRLVWTYPRVNPIILGKDRPNRITDMQENTPSKSVFRVQVRWHGLFRAKNLKTVLKTSFPQKRLYSFLSSDALFPQKLWIFAIILQNIALKKLLNKTIFKTSFPIKKVPPKRPEYKAMNVKLGTAPAWSDLIHVTLWRNDGFLHLFFNFSKSNAFGENFIRTKFILIKFFFKWVYFWAEKFLGCSAIYVEKIVKNHSGGRYDHFEGKGLSGDKNQHRLFCKKWGFEYFSCNNLKKKKKTNIFQNNCDFFFGGGRGTWIFLKEWGVGWQKWI